MAVKKTTNKRLETSKEIVIMMLVIFCISMTASYTLPIIFDGVGEIALSIFQTTATLTGSIQLGYYGKAGFENYDKNRNLLKFEKNKGEEDEPEGGNG